MRGENRTVLVLGMGTSPAVLTEIIGRFEVKVKMAGRSKIVLGFWMITTAFI
jgi:hypothetical protein